MRMRASVVVGPPLVEVIPQELDRAGEGEVPSTEPGQGLTEFCGVRGSLWISERLRLGQP